MFLRSCLLSFLFYLLFQSPALAQESSFKTELAKANHLSENGFPDSAMAIAGKVLAASIAKRDTAYQLRALAAKAYAFTYLHKTKEATTLFFDALKLCKYPADNGQASFICNELGYIYFERNDYNTAKTYFRQDLAIKRVMRDSDGVGSQLINLAGVHRLLKEYDSTAIRLSEVQKILSHKPDPALEGYYNMSGGTLSQATGKLDSALVHYQRAVYYFRLCGKTRDLLKALFNTGALQAEQKRYAQAIGYYLQSEHMADSLGLFREKITIHKGLADAYAAIKDFEKAYAHRYQYSILSDSLNKTDLNTAIAKLDKQFQTEQNRQTIQEQQLQLQAARNRTLLSVILLIVGLFALVLFGIYMQFKGRVRKQVEAAKEKFFSNVVHEIRTPLSMIQAPVQLLQKKAADPADKLQLDLAARNVLRLNELISQMLDLSKLDAVKYELRESYGSLHQFITGIALSFETQAAARQQVLISQVDVDLPNAWFDNDALEKILNNLLGNALKYTPEGGRIGLDASAISIQESMSLSLQVWDNGPGLSDTDQANIFNRFYRAADQQKAGVKGIGIGLSLVKELVELMHGSISVQSGQGGGAVFSLQLPIRIAAEKEAASLQPGSATVLLVEDDADILEFNRQLFTDAHLAVLTAGNAAEALAILDVQLPDLVITDRMMPGMDGIAFLKQLKSDTATAHIPVIMLSAKSAAGSRMEALEAGAQACLAKPFMPDELLALVKNQLEVLQKRKTEFKKQVSDPARSPEEKYAGTEPYTKKLFTLVFKHFPEPELTVEKLADLMATNRSHFQRKVKAITGFSPSELLKTIRLEKARELLLAKKGNVTEVAYASGFSSPSHFTKSFTQHFGMPPTQMLQNQNK